MKKIFLALLLCGTIAGCTTAGNPTPTSAVGNAAQQVAQICAAAQPLLQETTAQQAQLPATAQNLLAYAESACTASGAVAATLAPVVNATTPTWVEDVMTALGVVAQVAVPLLPFLGAV